ncbi:MAG TPA: hypothetical protein VIT91_09300 [Chthoniobacterales bacterium]
MLILAAAELIEDSNFVFAGTSVPWRFWVTVAGALLIIAAVAFSIWKKRRRQRMGDAASDHDNIPKEAPDVIALRRLAALEKRISELSAKEFALEVSEILRVFLEDRFELRAAHQSTEEFFLDVGDSDFLNATQRDELGDFLLCCDLAKFAQRHLEHERKITLLTSARRFVTEGAAASNRQENTGPANGSSQSKKADAR